MDVLSEYYLRKTITVSKRRLLYHFKTFGHRYLCEKLIISERILTDGFGTLEYRIAFICLCSGISKQSIARRIGISRVCSIQHPVCRGEHGISVLNYDLCQGILEHHMCGNECSILGYDQGLQRRAAQRT